MLQIENSYSIRFEFHRQLRLKTTHVDDYVDIFFFL